MSVVPRSHDHPRILSLAGVSVQLGGRDILSDVIVDIAPGQFVGLIGANGAGKTTLLRVILGLLAPTAGTVLVAGQPRSRRIPLIGYVPQKFMLDPDAPLRARDLIALGIDAHRFGIARPSRHRRAVVDKMLAAVNAPTSPTPASGGSPEESNRVLIAHALASRPQLLLLDEPLANLDLRSAHEVVSLLAASPASRRSRCSSRRMRRIRSSW